MDIPKDYTSHMRVEPSNTNERAEALRPIIERINRGRVQKGYVEYEASFIATQMAHIPTPELYNVYKQLTKARSFGGLWEHLYGFKKKKV